MATTLELTAYGTIISVLTTELNALANAANTVASAAHDNTTLLSTMCDMELVLGAQGSARTAGAQVLVYQIASVDGTNYPDLHEITAPPVARFLLDAAVTARRLWMPRVLLTPGLSKFFVRNITGQALAATLNTLKLRPYNLQNV